MKKTEVLILGFAILISMLAGYWLGFSFFEKKPAPPFEVTNQPVYACYVYSSKIVGSCDLYLGEIAVDGVHYYKVKDGFLNTREELKAASDLKLFYLIAK